MPDDVHCKLEGLQSQMCTICWNEQAVSHVQVAQLAELCKSRKHVCIRLPLRLSGGAAECHTE